MVRSKFSGFQILQRDEKLEGHNKPPSHHNPWKNVTKEIDLIIVFHQIQMITTFPTLKLKKNYQRISGPTLKSHSTLMHNYPCHECNYFWSWPCSTVPMIVHIKYEQLPTTFLPTTLAFCGSIVTQPFPKMHMRLRSIYGSPGFSTSKKTPKQPVRQVVSIYSIPKLNLLRVSTKLRVNK